MTVGKMCQAAAVSRAGYYRHRKARAAERPKQMEVRDQIQRIALKWPCYGRRRIRAELKKRGFQVNHKRVSRVMREDNLLAQRWRKFVFTTDSKHGHRVYENLAAKLELSGVNQLWVADITYIRLESEFVYLAVILDAYSRRVVGWAVGPTLEASLAVEALQQALKQRRPGAGLVHHSDRGVQYACREYTDILKQHGIQISMSRKGNPYDNAACESFMKTLKFEEVYRQEYRNLREVRASLEAFIDRVYNTTRLHSALGYRSPEEFERT